MITRIKKVKPW